LIPYPATILVPYDVFAETVNMVGKKQGHAKAMKELCAKLGDAGVRKAAYRGG
jgi:hypothetical protein